MTTSLRYAIHVPHFHRGVLAGVAEVTDDEFDSLLSSINGDKPATSLADLQRRLAAPDSDLDKALLLEALLGASNARIWRSALSHDVAAAIADFPDLDVEDDRRPVLAERLEALLETESLEIMAKGLDVLTEHERIYLRARVVTDIRPAFRPGDTAEPAAAVITHTLRMDVQENGEPRSIYLAMDESDLRQLQSVIDREVDKTEGLRRQVAGWGLTVLDFDEDPSDGGDGEVDEGA